MELSRRDFLKVSGAAGVTAVAVAGMVGCSSSSSDSRSDTKTSESSLLPAKIGYWGGTCEAEIMIAEAKGYYKECGIDAEVVKVTNGVSEIVANNEVDFWQQTPDVLPALYSGLKVKLIDNAHTGCIQGVATKESGIKSYKDLEGKKIGLISEGNMAQLFIQSLMKQAGMDYSKTEWIAYSDGGPAMAFKALENNEIDGLTWYDPYCEIGELAGYTKFFNNATDEAYKDYTCCFIAATQDIVDKSPETCKKVCQAMKKAADFITANPAEAAKIIQDSGYVTESANILESFGIKDTSQDIHERLLKSYTFCNGDKDMYDKSATKNWDILYYGTDVMTDAPAAGPGSSEYEKYIANLVEKGYKYLGE
ncbi:MAG: ABC transporter substrate-binding protein [Phoenicibacter congonensis]|uniref:ABC transporter substrate-binding protein n=1 Tax=Phoenicibacter congonensis TaxID=1944646 RepID=A0AA43U8T5_9ACTN|nr:ABC transporter substrate-binding protein [Phoenicibacter congonensis]